MADNTMTKTAVRIMLMRFISCFIFYREKNMTSSGQGHSRST